MKKGFVLGLATGVALTGASLVLANSQIQAILNTQIKVTLNGQVQEFMDETTNETQYPITYNNRTYLPLRTVANLVGVDVDYDINNNTAILKTKDYIESEDNPKLYSNEEIIRILKQIDELKEYYWNNLGLGFDLGGVQRLVVENIEKENNIYTITARLDTIYEITDNEYNNMINTGKIVIDGCEYLYKNDNEMKSGEFSTKAPYGYITIDNVSNEDVNSGYFLNTYAIIKSKNGYAFSAPLVGGGDFTIYRIENKLKFQADENIEIIEAFRGPIGTLNDVDNNHIIGDTILYSDGKIILESDPR